MKSLNVIQTLAKIGKVASNVIFVFSIIGACFCGIALATLPLAGKDPAQLGDVKIHGLFESEALASTPSLYVILAVTTVACIVGAIVSKFAVSYFKNELEDGTPFTIRGANELLRLGILNIVFSAAVSLICGIILLIASRYYPELEEFDLEIGSSIGMGIVMIIVSLFCRYGAELTEKTSDQSAAAEETPQTETEPPAEA